MTKTPKLTANGHNRETGQADFFTAKAEYTYFLTQDLYDRAVSLCASKRYGEAFSMMSKYADHGKAAMVAG